MFGDAHSNFAYTWSECGLSARDIETLVDGLELFGWDIVCIEEGQKNATSQTYWLGAGQIVIRAQGIGRGAPTFLLNARLSGHVREDGKGNSSCGGPAFSVTAYWHLVGACSNQREG